MHRKDSNAMSARTWSKVFFWLVWIPVILAHLQLAEAGISGWIRWPGLIFVAIALTSLRVSEYIDGYQAGMYGVRRSTWITRRFIDGEVKS
jgi:ABC-type Na+ efflux pump permease subunit